MKTIITIIGLTLYSTLAYTQNTAEEKMYQAYIQQNKMLWINAIEIMSQQVKQLPSNLDKKFKLAYAQFSLLNSTLAEKDEDLFNQYIASTKDYLLQLADNSETAGEAKALLSATYGLQIAYSPMKGMFLGGKSSMLAKKAKELNPASELTWRMYGSNKLYTPAAFGGDINEAIAALEKSLQLFERKPGQLKNNWLYLDTILLLGQAFQKNGNKEKAIDCYEKALSLEPNFSYAKQLLANVKK